MRIMLDTNVLISSLVFPNEKMSMIVLYVLQRHRLILSRYILDELKRIVIEKFPSKIKDLEVFLYKMKYELAENEDSFSFIFIRDPNDLPILVSAMNGDVDILISGDKDFLVLDLKRPRIMSPSAFFEEFVAF